jgi:hypothetical protein
MLDQNLDMATLLAFRRLQHLLLTSSSYFRLSRWFFSRVFWVIKGVF